MADWRRGVFELFDHPWQEGLTPQPYRNGSGQVVGYTVSRLWADVDPSQGRYVSQNERTIRSHYPVEEKRPQDMDVTWRSVLDTCHQAIIGLTPHITSRVRLGDEAYRVGDGFIGEQEWDDVFADQPEWAAAAFGLAMNNLRREWRSRLPLDVKTGAHEIARLANSTGYNLLYEQWDVYRATHQNAYCQPVVIYPIADMAAALAMDLPQAGLGRADPFVINWADTNGLAR